MVGRLDLKPATGIYVLDTSRMIEEFEGDEEVEYDFTEGHYLAKTKDRDTDNPLILVAADKHPSEDQVILSILHELGHLVLRSRSERKVEDWAYRKYRESGGTLEQW